MKIFTGLLTFLTLLNFATAGTTADRQKCVVDICGPAKNWLNMTYDGPFGNIVSRDQKDFYDQKIMPQVQVMLANVQKSKALSHDNYIKLMSSDLKLNNVQLSALLIRSFYMKYRVAILNSISLNSATSRNPFIDVNKLSQIVKEIDTELLKKTVSILNAFLSDSEAQTYINLQNVDYDRFMSLLSVAGNDLVLTYVSYVKESIAATNTSIGYNLFPGQILSICDKITTQQTLTAAEKSDFMKALVDTSFYKAITSKSTQDEFTKQAMNFDDVLAVLGLSKTAVLSPAAAGQLNSDMPSDVQACRLHTYHALSAAPSPLSYAKTQDLILKVKAAAKVAAGKYFENDNLSAARSAIDLVQVHAPASVDELKIQLEAKMQDLILQLNDNIGDVTIANSYAQQTGSFKPESLAVSIISQESVLLNENKNSTQVATVCRDLRPRLFEDHSESSGKDIVIGWETTLFKEIGAGVIAHEIGHAVSTTVAPNPSDKMNFLNTRVCSAKNHLDLANLMQVNISEDMYQEEDWADSFASSTMIELNKTWPHSHNFGCALVTTALGANDDAAQFTDLALLDPYSEDVHSKGVYRLLQIQSDLGLPIPESCNTAYGEEALKAATNKCAL